jgi:hypothetical protein
MDLGWVRLAPLILRSQAPVVHAFALRRLSRFQIAALTNVLAAKEDDDVFVWLIEHTLAVRRGRSAA